ncbi:MAG: hypothetical protein IPO01_04515 [Chitinophagaceae bacterium]|nr:hypothetical protein [Chitinophagaceae bacterium]MBK7307032.1 hypothetical protein [Chitinophagaceae bacterium]MBK8785287.1 hypothetical protein [Chitinophagaceae bacterium]MBK9484485.1 hypothetical protein [Chitinophagaceae bacterium]MBL0199078.1 hypothetical protein [Chitinophagaceae bacterium]
MKKLFEISLLFFLCLTLCACPYSSAYYLDETSGMNVQDALLGKWTTYMKKPGSSGEEEIYLSLSKKTDTEYHISITGNLNELRPYRVLISDSLTGTAFMSLVDNRQFLNININSRIYIAELKLKDDKLSLLPLAENFTGKMVRNTADLRKSVEVHYKTRVHPLLDDDFCLRNMVKLN